MRVVLLALALSACAVHSAPKTVLADYLAAEQSGRYADAHALLSSTDRAARPLDAYVEEHRAAGPIWLAVAERTHFRLGAEDDEGDHVAIAVHARHADPHLVEEALRAGEGATPFGTPPDLKTQSAAVLDQFAVPAVDERIPYALREEDGRWRVWLGLDRQDAAIDATARARAAEQRGDVATATAAWREVLAVQLDPAGVVARLQEEARTRVAAP